MRGAWVFLVVGVWGATGALTASANPDLGARGRAALKDNILSVIDLPLAAMTAREQGVLEAELRAALLATQEGGMSAGVATEIIEEEARSTGQRGQRGGLGRFLRRELAKGKSTAEILRALKARENDPKQLTVREQAKLRNAKARRTLRRQSLRARRDALNAKGYRSVFTHSEQHAERNARLAERRRMLSARWRRFQAKKRVAREAASAFGNTQGPVRKVSGVRRQAQSGLREKSLKVLQAQADRRDPEQELKAARRYRNQTRQNVARQLLETEREKNQARRNLHMGDRQ